MELSYVGMRRRAVSLLYWSAVSLGVLAVLTPVATDIPAPVAAGLLVFAGMFTLWIQWKNGHGGFGSVRGLRPTFETRAMLSPGQWFMLFLVLVMEAAALAFLVVG